MNDTDGLLAEAQVEGDDNQQQAEENTIPHQLPDNEPSLDSVTVAKEGEEIELERPEWYPDKFWNEDEGPDLENLVKSYNELKKKFSQGEHNATDNCDKSIFEVAGVGDDDPVYNVYRDWA